MTAATLPGAATRLLVVTIGAALVAVSCGDTSTTGRIGTRPTSATTSVRSTSTTTLATSDCSTPTLAARAVVAAAVAGDRTAAGQCATPDAVSTLLAAPRRAGWTFQGCDGPDPGVPVCTFAYPGGVGRLTLTGTEAAGWSVERVQLSP